MYRKSGSQFHDSGMCQFQGPFFKVVLQAASKMYFSFISFFNSHAVAMEEKNLFMEKQPVKVFSLLTSTENETSRGVLKENKE